MSRTAKTWLIIAGILVVLGPALIVFSAAGGVGFSNIGREKYEEKTYEIGATFDQIDVKTDIANVVLATADECRVVCDSSEKLTDSAEVKNGALVIRSEKNTKWYDNLFSFSFNSPKIKVYLPEKMYNTLKIESETGDAVIAEGLTFGNLLIAGDTSDIACAADIKDSAGFAVSTGDITLGGSVGTANIATTTGDVVMLSVKGTGDISVATDTGDINIEKSTCDGCSIKSNTGDITLTNTVAGGTLDIRSNTGDVTFDRSDGKAVTVNTTTGEVEGSLLSEKIISVKTSTGEVKVPDSSAGGKCEITTTTGDVTITVER